jgi:hypothetical protein
MSGREIIMNGVRVRTLEIPGDRGEVLYIDCVPTTVTHVIPPAGDEYAFDIQNYKRRVEIYVSKTGRSVRVWVDGKEIK